MCRLRVLRRTWNPLVPEFGGGVQGTLRSSTQLGSGEPSGCWEGRDSLFKRWCWSNWTSTDEGMNLDPDLAPYKETNPKWIVDLNAKRKL